MTMAPAAANRGACTRDVDRAGREQRDVEAARVGGRGVLDDDVAVTATAACCRPTARRRRSGARSTGKSRSASSRRITPPTCPVAPTTPTREAAHRPVPP